MVYLVPGGVCSRGCTWSQGGVPGPKGVYLVTGGIPGPRGVYLVLGGVPGPGGCTWSQGGVCSSAGGVPGQVLPPVDRQTPVNLLPCPKLRLRAVKITADLHLVTYYVMLCIFSWIRHTGLIQLKIQCKREFKISLHHPAIYLFLQELRDFPGNQLHLLTKTDVFSSFLYFLQLYFVINIFNAI